MKYAILNDKLVVEDIQELETNIEPNNIPIGDRQCDIGYYYDSENDVFTKEPYEKYECFLETYGDTNVNEKLHFLVDKQHLHHRD